MELETLSLAEIAAAHPVTNMPAVILRGGYPELHANPDVDTAVFCNSYLATYLERDVRSLANVGSLRDFERFLRACALRSGNLLNKADLARDVGIAPSPANEWISVLQASGIVVLLEPWFSNRTKSIIKSPKLYLADTGVLCALLNIRSVEVLPIAPGACFWRNRTREVDFVVDIGGRVEQHEARWSEVPSPSDATNLRYARQIIGPTRVAACGLVSRTINPYPLDDVTTVLRASDLT